MVRVLLSTIGSRGDVQPLVALAFELRTLGTDVRLCVPPDFGDWIASLGMGVTLIGPELRRPVSNTPATPTALSPDQRRQLAEATVTTQFETIAAAAQDCDMIVAATALQIAARSVAQKRNIPYVFVAYCPIVLPSPHHAPPPLPAIPGQTPAPAADNCERWARDGERFNELFRAALNSHRASLGLAAVDDARHHVVTDRPWLAADPALAPWPDAADDAVFQPGAWFVPEERPLPLNVESFLQRGDPPVYFGVGSMRAPRELGQVIVEAARGLGRRAIVSRGWADLSVPDGRPDCLAVDEINQQALFKRVAAVVHHGGAGTTTAAALAGVPQVVVPQLYDQHYWAERVHILGIGTAHAPGPATVDSLTQALERTLEPEIVHSSQSLSGVIRRDGARTAAECVIRIGQNDAGKSVSPSA